MTRDRGLYGPVLGSLEAGRTLLIDLDSQASASLSLAIDRVGFNPYIADVIKKRLEG